MAGAMSTPENVTPMPRRKDIGAPTSPEHVRAEPAAPWEPAVSLYDSGPPTPFPLDYLPEKLRAFVDAVAIGQRTVPDLVGAFALAVISTALRGHFQTWDGGSHFEPVTLHVAVIGESGTRKSGTVGSCIAPLQELQAELEREHKPSIAVAESKRRTDEKRLADLEKTAASSATSPTTERERDELAYLLANEPKAVVPRLFTTDATPEKLEAMMSEQGGAIAWLSAEGGFYKAGGRYQKGGGQNLEVFKAGHAGDPLNSDRLSRDAASIERASLTVGIATQPDAFRAAANHPEMAGEGLLARQLITWPDLPIPNDSLGPSAPVPEHVANAYRDLVRELYRVGESIGRGQVRTLTFDPDADDALRAWFAQTYERRQHGNDLASLPSWAGKLNGATMRLAAIVALSENPQTLTIDLRAATRGIELARYFASHAVRAFGDAGLADGLRNARACLEAIRKAKPKTDADGTRRTWKDWPAQVSRRDIHEAVKGTKALSDAEEVGQAMHVLEGFGWIREVAGPQRNAYRYEVNPALFEPPA
jgi:replicative DNA helicase